MMCGKAKDELRVNNSRLNQVNFFEFLKFSWIFAFPMLIKPVSLPFSGWKEVIKMLAV